MQNRQAMLGTYLHERRTALGLSQRQLALHTDIRQARISQFEAGTVMPSLMEIEKLSQVLNVDPVAFLQASGIVTRPVDFTRLPLVLVRALRQLDEHGLELLAYTAQGLLLQQSEEPPQA